MTKVRTLNSLLIFVVKRDIPLMCVRARTPINMKNLKTWVTVTNIIIKVIRNMTIGLEPLGDQDLKVTITTTKSMDIEPLNENPSLCGHQTN